MINPIRHNYHRSQTVQFNLMPLIDVVLLLIVFFMLICEFISRENYRLDIPENCTNALTPDQANRGDTITLSVFQDPHSTADVSLQSTPSPDDHSILFAVRNRQFNPNIQSYQQHPDQLIDDMAKQIEQQIKLKGKSLVHLRADKNLPYGEVQKSLMALSKAHVQKVQLAALRSGQNHTIQISNEQ